MTIWRLLVTLPGEKGWKFWLFFWNHTSLLCLCCPALFIAGHANKVFVFGLSKPTRVAFTAPLFWVTELGMPSCPIILRWHLQEPLPHHLWGTPCQAVWGVDTWHPYAMLFEVAHVQCGVAPMVSLHSPREAGGAVMALSPGCSHGGRGPEAALGRPHISTVPICLGGASSLRAPATMAQFLLPVPCLSRLWHLQGSVITAQFAWEIRL